MNYADIHGLAILAIAGLALGIWAIRRRRNENDALNNPSVNTPWLKMAGVSLVIIATLIITWVMIVIYIPEWENRGHFGSAFGAVGALFSGLAFGLLIYTVLLQSQELRLQREELKLTREELEGQKNQLEKHTEAFYLQSFENKFFQLLQIHNSIVNSTSIFTGSMKRTGRECFEILRKGIISEITNAPPSEGVIRKIWERHFFKDNQSILGHYFRNLYNIIKFIENSDVNNKKFYTNIVRAQLSNGELILIFFNCITELGEKKFKPLVEKYSLLKNMPRGDFESIGKGQLIDLYDKNTFM